MDEKDLSKIAKKLKITIPDAYRDLMQNRNDLREMGCFDGEYSNLFLDPQNIINSNLWEREKDAVEYAFPGWWKKFFMVGTNGGGDYYCLRLDNTPGVWMIGSDCGDKPTLTNDTFREYIDQLIAEHEEEQQWLAEVAQRQLPYQEEMAAHLDAINRDEGSKNAKEWLEKDSGYGLLRMLDRLRHKVSPRKMRLYGIACCRLIRDLEKDTGFAAAIGVAMRMTAEQVPEPEIAEMRARLREKMERLEQNYSSMEPSEYRSGRWRTRAVLHLFQYDNDYLNDVDPDLNSSLVEVCNALGYVLHEEPYDSGEQGEYLLREVIGNPFHPVLFEPQWRTDAVVELARTIYENETFDQMGALANALTAAGCNDLRILTHCQRENNHCRGCWVLDLILQNETEPSDVFTWDFKATHPNLDPVELKKQLQKFGSLSGERDRNNDQSVREFADWLEENGDPTWADYIRVRCALDGKSPGDDYADLIERCFELGARMQYQLVKFEGFYFNGSNFASDEWWEDETDDMDRGVPAMVDAITPGKDSAGPADLIAERIEALVEQTPVRGINFESHYVNDYNNDDDMDLILNSSGAESLRWLAFGNFNSEEGTDPVIRSLVKSPLVKTIERLDICSSFDDDAVTLAQASFESLHRLDLDLFHDKSCSKKAAQQLFKAPWFHQLRQLSVGFPEGCEEIVLLHLADMPRLHSLALIRPPREQILALNQTGEFSALRRLTIRDADLTGKQGEAFCRINAPGLVELHLSRSAAKIADLCSMITSPIFDNLHVLTFKGPRLNEKSLDLLAKAPCATELRILRLNCGDDNLIGSFKSLGSLAFTQPDTFPSLTTLQIEHPYKKNAQRDTAELLKKFTPSKLRHLKLDDCDFDDDCAAALANNPAFANLTRLYLHQSYDATSLLSKKAAIKMLRSENLRNLVELGLHNFAIGEALDVLADQSVMPKLASGSFWGSGASSQTQERLNESRPMIHIGS